MIWPFLRFDLHHQRVGMISIIHQHGTFSMARHMVVTTMSLQLRL
jgi:hypothetical protein